MTEVENKGAKPASSNTAMRSIITAALAGAASTLLAFLDCNEDMKEKILFSIPAIAVFVSDGCLWIFKAYSPEDAQVIKARRESKKALKRIGNLLKSEKDPEMIKNLNEKRKAHTNIIAE